MLVATFNKPAGLNEDNLVAVTVLSGSGAGGILNSGFQVRRLTEFSGSSESTA